MNASIISVETMENARHVAIGVFIITVVLYQDVENMTGTVTMVAKINSMVLNVVRCVGHVKMNATEIEANFLNFIFFFNFE